MNNIRVRAVPKIPASLPCQAEVKIEVVCVIGYTLSRGAILRPWRLPVFGDDSDLLLIDLQPGLEDAHAQNKLQPVRPISLLSLVQACGMIGRDIQPFIRQVAHTVPCSPDNLHPVGL